MSNKAQQASGANAAKDIPGTRPVELDRFDALVGAWELEASFEAGYFGPDSPAIANRVVRTTFEWLEGCFFLIQRFVSRHPAAPGGMQSLAQAKPQPRLSSTTLIHVVWRGGAIAAGRGWRVSRRSWGYSGIRVP